MVVIFSLIILTVSIVSSFMTQVISRLISSHLFSSLNEYVGYYLCMIQNNAVTCL